MRQALSFLTPFGRANSPTPKAMVWFGPVGALIGAALGTLWWASQHWTTWVAAAAIAVVGDVVLTGYLHLDGLADSADGLIAPMDRQRRLDAMADPAVGAIGVVTLVTVLLLRFAAFASMKADILVVSSLWCASRAWMTVVARTLPYARPGGLASVFVGEGGTRTGGQHSVPGALTKGAIGFAMALVMAILGRGLHGVVALVAEAGVVIAVMWFAKRRIGGFTGDVLGACGVLGETAGLIALALH